MIKPKILIPTCNKYIHYVEALQYSVRETGLSEFEFIIIGDEKPKFELDKNWSFVSIGQDSPASKWSTRMRMFLEDFSDEVFIYGCDDCAITYLDMEKLEVAIQVASNFRKIGRVALMAEGRKRPIEGFLTNISKFSNESEYRLSLGWSVYNKECFLQFCEQGMTPWAFELQSNDPNKKEELDKWRFLTFLPSDGAIDGAFFARKHINGLIPDWHKGYYGHDLEGERKEIIEKMLTKSNY